MPTTKLYWHIHHDVLLEETSNIQERIDYIKAEKPEAEIPLRLKLMTPVLHPEKLPARFQKVSEDYNKAWKDYYKAKEACYKAGEAFNKAEEDYDKAREACYKAREAYYKAEEDYDKAREASAKVWEAYYTEIEKLHREEHPDCPWNGETIFSKVD